jgi:hypothetical protein
MRHVRSTLLALALFALPALLLACSSGDPVRPGGHSPEEVEEETPPLPVCVINGTVTSEDGTPMGGIPVEGTASERTSETSWKGIAFEKTVTKENGRFGMVTLPCGTRISLEFDGWVWPVHPDLLKAEKEMPELEVRLVPARQVKLNVAGADGVTVKGTFVRAGQEEALPIPLSGLLVEGISYGRVAGTVSAPGLGERVWRLNRSDELHEVGPGHFEAIVHLGPEAPLWVVVPGVQGTELSGIWCVADGVRAADCKLRDGGWHCPCGTGDLVGIAAKRWDVGIVRQVERKDLEIVDLPEPIEQCITVARADQVIIHPEGVEDTLLLGARGPADGLCMALPKGEKLLVVEEGEPPDVMPHVAEEPGDVALR